MRAMGRMRSVPVALAAAVGLFGGPLSGYADSFQQVAYDPTTDELVVSVIYRGTNPDHEFSLVWGACQTHPDGQREIAGELLDSQARDAARQSYRKTVRISIADLACRPATVTVRTAPRFEFQLRVPASPAGSAVTTTR